MSRIFLSKADVGELEEEYVLRAIRSGWVTSMGPDVDAFEAEVAQRVGVRGALAVSSGTAGLHLSLLAMGVGPGDTVVLPSMTFAASANAVAYTGATPVFIESQEADGNIDPDILIHAIDTLKSEGTTVSAVMTVDLFGRCAEYDSIVNALAQRGVQLLEDAAEAFGASLGPDQAGSFGRAAVLSFNGNKIMTTSAGGMILSDDPKLISRCRHLSAQARQPTPHYEHTEIGYNYRLSNILAGLGRAQLVRLDSLMRRRRQIRQRYAAGLSDVEGIRVLASDLHRASSRDNCWLTSIVFDPEVVTITIDELIKALDAENIEARHLWKPMHLQPVFNRARSFLTGASEYLFTYGASLPSGSGLTDDDIDKVLAVVHNAVGRCST